MNFYASFTLFLPFIAATACLLTWAARLLYFQMWKQQRRIDALVLCWALIIVALVWAYQLIAAITVH